MSNMKTDGGLSYTIPVDSLDLKYLSKYVSSTGILPLWTKTRLNGEDGYCQVQILAQNEEECYSEPTDTYECHICNVHVPLTCSEDHNESEQHKTFKNIYQKILEKLSKQMDTSIVKHDEKIDKDAYYCVSCSKIIKKENRDKHESSEFHAKSIKDTIIISEFYKIINDDRSQTDDIIVIEERLTQDSDLEPVNIKSCTENNNYAITINKLNNNYFDNSHDNLTTYANKLATPGPSKNDNKIHPSNDAIPGPCKNDNKIHPPNDATPGPRNQLPNDDKAETYFEDYLEAMIKKYKLKVNLPVISFEDIYLESSDGQTVIVSPEHFQSYKQLKNSIYCQLCKMWISQDTRLHDATETHVRNIFKPINEKFARTIDSVSSHCVPCNYVVLTDSAQHTLDDNHRKIIKDTRRKKVGMTYCEDCNLTIDINNLAVHILKNHLNGIMLKQTEKPNIFFCTLCNLTVSKNALKNHFVTRTHFINYVCKLNNNGATDSDNKNTDSSRINDKNTKPDIVNYKNTDNSEYCVTCKVDVPIGGMVEHVDGKKHKERTNQLNKNDIKCNENKAQNSNSISTNTSTTTIDSIASTSTSSSIGNAEIKNDLSDAKIDEYYELLEFADDCKTEVRCKICMVYIGFVESLIIDHMESKIHIENVTRQKLNEYYKFLSYTDDAQTKVNCEICYVNIPYVDRNIIEHMEGRHHAITVTELLKIHLITKQSSWYLCECCEVQTADYLEHINSRSHTITFSQKYEMDKTEMRKYVYESDVNDVVARCHRVRYRNLLKHNGIYKLNDTSYYCGMCQIKLGRISELYHVLGERHALKLAKIDEYYKFLTYYTDDAITKVYCEICYVIIPNVDSNIIEHMESRNHDIAVTDFLEFHLITKESSRYLCECCDVQTTDYLEHINSRSHTITFLQKHEIDKTEMRKYVYDSDVNDVVAYRHRVRYRNLLKHNDISELNNTSYYCGMCQIKLGRISELDHVLGERHALKLAEIEDIFDHR